MKGNQATFDNSQRNNLRSCVWVFGGSVRSVSSSFREKRALLYIYLFWGVVRSGDSG